KNGPGGEFWAVSLVVQGVFVGLAYPSTERLTGRDFRTGEPDEAVIHEQFFRSSSQSHAYGCTQPPGDSSIFPIHDPQRDVGSLSGARRRTRSRHSLEGTEGSGSPSSHHFRTYAAGHFDGRTL